MMLNLVKIPTRSHFVRAGSIAVRLYAYGHVVHMYVFLLLQFFTSVWVKVFALR